MGKCTSDEGMEIKFTIIFICRSDFFRAFTELKQQKTAR